MKLDVFDFKVSGRVTLDFLKEKKVTSLDYFHLIESAYIDFCQKLDDEYPIDQISYDAVYLYKLCKADETDSDKSRRYLARHLKKLAVFMEQHSAEFEEFAKGKDAKSWLCFVPDESGGKKLNTYFAQLNTIEQAPSQKNIRALHIHYRVSQLKDTPKLAKPFSSFKFDGIARWAPAVFIAAIYISFIILLFSGVGLLPKAWLASSIIISSMLCLVVCMFLPYFKLLDRSVVQAPQWLLRLNKFAAQIELINTGDKRKDGSTIREIRTVVYEGICPICNGKVDVIQSGKEFHQRLIGQCQEARFEHLFSFDHITKKGVFLRESASY
ncbi:MAG: hypothetical protein ACPG52_06255 [Cognaticolwellia sp.]